MYIYIVIELFQIWYIELVGTLATWYMSNGTDPKYGNYDPPLPCLGVRGTPRFTLVSCHTNVCWHPVHPRLCQSLFMQYFLQFFAHGFQILRYGGHGHNLELINFS